MSHFEPKNAPGPTPLELLRAVPAIRANPPAYLLRCARQYGDVVRFQAGTVSAVFVNHPDAVRHVLQDNNHNYTKDTVQYNALSTVTGKGLLTSDGAFWLRQRRLAQPAFARPRLEALGPLVETAAGRMLAGWDTPARPRPSGARSGGRHPGRGPGDDAPDPRGGRSGFVWDRPEPGSARRSPEP